VTHLIGYDSALKKMVVSDGAGQHYGTDDGERLEQLAAPVVSPTSPAKAAPGRTKLNMGAVAIGKYTGTFCTTLKKLTSSHSS